MGEEAKRPPLTRPYARNLLLLVICGVATTGWILFYTDWFPVFAGLIALGGVFSWLGVIAKLLPEDRIKELQRSIDERISRSSTYLALRIWLGAQLAIWSSVGALELRPIGSEATLGIFEGGPRAGPPDAFLDPGSPTRLLYFCGPFVRREIEIKVQGHPARAFRVRGGFRTSALFPRAFERLVFVIRPSVNLATNTMFANGADLELAWTLKDGTSTSTTIRTYADTFWLGTDADIAVPEYLIARWQTEGALGEVLARWRAPREIAPLRDVHVEQLQTLTYRWHNKAGKALAPPRRLALPARLERGRFIEDLRLN